MEFLCRYRPDELEERACLLLILTVQGSCVKEGPGVTGKRMAGLLLMLAGSVIFVLWGTALSHAKPLGGLDFRALYEGAGCLLHHCDPYNADEVRDYYISTGDARLYPPWALYTLALLNYLPTIYPFIAPFALLPWAAAQQVWTVLTAVGFLLAAYAMWKLTDGDAPILAGCLIGLLLANSEITLSGGNAAGFVVSLCVLAVWCILKERFALGGVLCLAASLAMKPHDAGLVWLYFVLVGGSYRKRAWQTLAVNVVLGVAALVWISEVAPHWFPELRSTMAIYSTHGGANDPGITGSPNSSFRNFSMAVYPGMVCDLQTIVAVFCDNPKFYNPFTYAFCAPIFIVWVVATLRSRFTQERAYLALAAIVPFTILVTYHRTTDTRLLLLTVPACVLLWSKGGRLGKLALVVNGLGILVAGDISLIVLGIIAGRPNWASAGLFKKIALIGLTRPVPIVLLAMGFFYLCVYVRSAWVRDEGTEFVESDSVQPAPASA